MRRPGVHSTHRLRKLVFLAQRHVLGAFGLIIMVMFVLVALFADVISRFDPLSADFLHRLPAPKAQHRMGTVSLGRDRCSRLNYHARNSLAVLRPPPPLRSPLSPR